MAQVDRVNSKVGGDFGSAGYAHIVNWGLILTSVIAALLLISGLNLIQAAMIVGSTPFSFMMILMEISLIKMLYRDGLRAKEQHLSDLII
ncbi:MAG: choline-glycine betaine transporter [Gammaproteobacteria bacterium]|jgi:choline-glycine betaine transporter